MILYILNYNNYYNRLFKKEDALIDYLDYLETQIDNVNFNPNDDIRTTQVINSNGKGDYAILSDGTNIISRWFILESTRQRNGQYRLDLKRDLVIDNYDKIINSPCFIERAILGNNDPMIFNDEGMTFNQIKTNEVLLKDESQCPWLVAYIARGEDLTLSYNTIEGIQNYTVDSLRNWEYNKYRTEPYSGYLTEKIYAIGVHNTTTNANVQYTFNEDGACNSYYKNASGEYEYGKSPIVANGIIPLPQDGYPIDQLISNNNDALDALISEANKNKTALDQQLKQYISYHTVNELTEFLYVNQKFIYETSSSTMYAIDIIDLSNDRTVVPITSGNLFDTLQTITTSTGIQGTAGDKSFAVSYKTSGKWKIKLTEVSFEATTIEANIGANDRYQLTDAPYDMICMPYSDDVYITAVGTSYISGWSNKRLALEFMTNLAKKYSAEGTKYLYDLQLVPYCPIRYALDTSSIGVLSLQGIKVTEITSKPIGGEEGSKYQEGFIFSAQSSSFSFDIKHKIEVNDYKQESQTDMYRLCSPNFNGQFEFNAAMNNGVDYFNVDVTYKPYQPYIHINPNFKGLYGKDYNDARGLICGGDFSMPILTNAWESYQLSNKNYEQIFSRQIQNMKVQQKVQRTQDIIGAATGTLTGAGAGFMVGGPVGAVIGGVASAAGGAADIALNETLRREQISYATDMWNYQLGNIQALPDSLSKTTAYTYNNKVFPILEYYTCTDREKNALNDKIKYNSMNVGRIGKIVDFLQFDYSYVKAKLIRLEGTNNDSQYISEIAKELSKGVYIK